MPPIASLFLLANWAKSSGGDGGKLGFRLLPLVVSRLMSQTSLKESFEECVLVRAGENGR